MKLNTDFTTVKRESKDDLSGNWVAIIVFMLIMSAITIIVTAITNTLTDWPMLWIIFLFVPTATSAYLLFGLYALVHKAARSGISSVKDGFQSLKLAWKYIFFCVLFNIIILTVFFLIAAIFLFGFSALGFGWESSIGYSIAPSILITFASAIYLIIQFAPFPFLLMDNPKMNFGKLISSSLKLMKGYKWNYFVFQLSFIGWYLLLSLTCGILCLYVIPYVYTANCNYYTRILTEYRERFNSTNSNYPPSSV